MPILKIINMAIQITKTLTKKADSIVLTELQSLPDLDTPITSYTSNLGVSRQVTWNGTPTDKDLIIMQNYFGTGNDSSFV